MVRVRVRVEARVNDHRTGQTTLNPPLIKRAVHPNTDPDANSNTEPGSNPNFNCLTNPTRCEVSTDLAGNGKVIVTAPKVGVAVGRRARGVNVAKGMLGSG